MLRYIIIAGLFLIVYSCGQRSKPAVSNTMVDSAAIKIKVNATDPANKPNDTAATKIDRDANINSIKNLPAILATFVPAGYTAIDTTSGDLNLDQYPDMVMVLQKNGEDTTSAVANHPEKRPLLLLIGQADGSYKLIARSDNAVYCADCGGMIGDPFMQVVIKKGFFSIEHYGGSGLRWTRTITFKYSSTEKYWFLHKDGHESFYATDPEKVKTKIYTIKDFGNVPFDKFDIYKTD